MCPSINRCAFMHFKKLSYIMYSNNGNNILILELHIQCNRLIIIIIIESALIVS